MVFAVVSLAAMTKKQSESHLLADVADGQYLLDAASWLVILGLLVSFLQTQLLMERLVRDRYVEYGIFINIGVPRATVIKLICLEQLGHTVIGGVFGMLFGGCLLVLVPLSGDFVEPDASSLVAAVMLAVGSPAIGVLPVATMLVLRLLKAAGGIQRVR